MGPRAAAFSVLLIAGLAGACGGSTPSHNAAATHTASTVSSVTPTPPTPAGPLSARYVLMFVGGVYLNILDLTGHLPPGNVTGYAQTSRTQIASTAAGTPTPLPLVSASRTRIYYLEGDSTVRFVGVDNSQGVAASVPGGQLAHATFAVSPDDQRIAVSVLDYSSSPVRMRMYVEDLATGANHVEIFSSSSVYEWPVAWHAGHLIVAVGRAYVTADAPNPYEAFGGYHVVDPANGNRLAAIGSSSCQVTGPLTLMGTVCSDGASLNVLDWNGNAVWSAGAGLTVGALSPDGDSVAACCAAAGESVVILKRDGTTVPTRAAGRFQTWIDATHVLCGSSPAGGPYNMLDVSTGIDSTYPASGEVYEGVFPLDLG